MILQTQAERREVWLRTASEILTKAGLQKWGHSRAREFVGTLYCVPKVQGVPTDEKLIAAVREQVPGAISEITKANGVRPTHYELRGPHLTIGYQIRRRSGVQTKTED